MTCNNPPCCGGTICTGWNYPLSGWAAYGVGQLIIDPDDVNTAEAWPFSSREYHHYKVTLDYDWATYPESFFVPKYMLCTSDCGLAVASARFDNNCFTSRYESSFDFSLLIRYIHTSTTWYLVVGEAIFHNATEMHETFRLAIYDLGSETPPETLDLLDLSAIEPAIVENPYLTWMMENGILVNEGQAAPITSLSFDMLGSTSEYDTSCVLCDESVDPPRGNGEPLYNSGTQFLFDWDPAGVTPPPYSCCLSAQLNLEEGSPYYYGDGTRPLLGIPAFYGTSGVVDYQPSWRFNNIDAGPILKLILRFRNIGGSIEVTLSGITGPDGTASVTIGTVWITDFNFPITIPVVGGGEFVITAWDESCTGNPAEVLSECGDLSATPCILLNLQEICEDSDQPLIPSLVYLSLDTETCTYSASVTLADESVMDIDAVIVAGLMTVTITIGAIEYTYTFDMGTGTTWLPGYEIDIANPVAYTDQAIYIGSLHLEFIDATSTACADKNADLADQCSICSDGGLTGTIFYYFNHRVGDETGDGCLANQRWLPLVKDGTNPCLWTAHSEICNCPTEDAHTYSIELEATRDGCNQSLVATISKSGTSEWVILAHNVTVGELACDGRGYALKYDSRSGVGEMVGWPESSEMYILRGTVEKWVETDTTWQDYWLPPPSLTFVFVDEHYGEIAFECPFFTHRKYGSDTCLDELGSGPGGSMYKGGDIIYFDEGNQRITYRISIFLCVVSQSCFKLTASVGKDYTSYSPAVFHSKHYTAFSDNMSMLNVTLDGDRTAYVVWDGELVGNDAPDDGDTPFSPVGDYSGDEKTFKVLTTGLPF